MNGGVHGSLYWSSVGSPRASRSSRESCSRSRSRFRATRSSVAYHENRRTATVRGDSTASRTSASVGVRGDLGRVRLREKEGHRHVAAVGSRSHGRSHWDRGTANRHRCGHPHVFVACVRTRDVAKEASERRPRVLGRGFDENHSGIATDLDTVEPIQRLRRNAVGRSGDVHAQPIHNTSRPPIPSSIFRANRIRPVRCTSQ